MEAQGNITGDGSRGLRSGFALWQAKQRENLRGRASRDDEGRIRGGTNVNGVSVHTTRAQRWGHQKKIGKDEDTRSVLIEVLGSHYGHGEVPMGWNVLED